VKEIALNSSKKITCNEALEFAPISELRMIHGDALLYCAFCNYGGYNDWRMMTHAEWYVLPNSGRIATWLVDDMLMEGEDLYHVVPVRTKQCLVV
jgi:hypothetical protein